MAILGLIVNGVSVRLLGVIHSHHDHCEEYPHEHEHWMDPVMGILDAILVSSWSLELLRTTSRVYWLARDPDNFARTL